MIFIFQGEDGGGLQSNTVVDILIAKAPNTGGPTFPKSSFTAVVSEDTEPGHRLITLKVRINNFFLWK